MATSGSVVVSIKDAVRDVHITPGGATERILSHVEQEFQTTPPDSVLAAFDLLDRGAKSVNPTWAGGIPLDFAAFAAGQECELAGAYGKALVRPTGEIVVHNKSGIVILHLVPPP